MPTIYLSLGANCGEREATLLQALDILALQFDSFKHTPLYETPDCHGGVKSYLNTVASAQTALMPAEIDRIAKELELKFGRTPTARMRGDVPLDIDLVVYGDTILKERDFNRNFFKSGYSRLINS